MLIFDVPKIISVFYEKENDLLIHEWFDYNPEDKDDVIFEILQKLRDISSTYPVEKLIVRVSQTRGAFSVEAQDYIENIQIPVWAESGVMPRYVAVIQSKETMKAIAASLWEDRFRSEDKMILLDVESEVEARDWLKSFP